jgi:hypothetical protein
LDFKHLARTRILGGRARAAEGWVEMGVMLQRVTRCASGAVLQKKGRVAAKRLFEQFVDEGTKYKQNRALGR